MQFVAAIRSKSVHRMQSGDEDDPLAQLSSPLPEEKAREMDMVMRFPTSFATLIRNRKIDF